jgi:hypothetical protein
MRLFAAAWRNREPRRKKYRAIPRKLCGAAQVELISLEDKAYKFVIRKRVEL